MCSDQQQTCARDIVTSLPCVLDSEGGGAVMFGRSLVTGLGIGLDYKWSLWGLEDTSEEHQEVMKAVHTRSASKILDTCLENGGLYIKFGQVRCRIPMFTPAEMSPQGLCTQGVLPAEYSAVLTRLQDQALRRGAAGEVDSMILEDLGTSKEELFTEFSEEPIAAASLAQVAAAIFSFLNSPRMICRCSKV